MDRSQYGVIAALMGSGAGAVLRSERLGFDVIVGGSEDDFAKVEVLEAGKTNLVLQMVEAVEDNYDFVFYDVKGGLEFWAKNALSAAHFVIAPVEGYDAVATAKTVKQEVPAGVGFGVVTMRLRKGENDYGDVFFELDAQGLLGDVIGSVRKSADVSRAPKFGPAVLERAGKLPASELMDIGDWIIANVAVGEAVA